MDKPITAQQATDHITDWHSKAPFALETVPLSKHTHTHTLSLSLSLRLSLSLSLSLSFPLDTLSFCQINTDMTSDITSSFTDITSTHNNQINKNYCKATYQSISTQHISYPVSSMTTSLHAKC